MKLAKLDLSKNLIPLKYVNDINKKCDQNNDKTDDKLMPRLMREYTKQVANKKQPEDFERIYKEMDHLHRLENADLRRCETIK